MSQTACRTLGRAARHGERERGKSKVKKGPSSEGPEGNVEKVRTPDRSIVTKLHTPSPHGQSAVLLLTTVQTLLLFLQATEM